ncbi:hypothetical protein CO005_03710 [Candidatus Roizmanbacteria bacterium CG_4_8_14_3_um_filter_34_9]|uniref:Uncharacterized protein n=2 Tax=Candidatus Roizmaniibacteriota TaxID=1752723 RepID=A0A2M6YUR8_9BACT|nr:MAG: hypothetical protein COT02_02115 [Candidatus Roizmanbacteria bacterium CG07_land_8_20_14_0_80_34_15]PIW73018.1 MAG: hypothetical protein CO005_03710 [Candidatus Roizmanbacteria bacterium CG_4_8_14_3_um_filter_34_9]
MDVFSLLSYINKVSLMAFFVTTIFVGYQIYILKKEKNKDKTPTIPDFREKNNLNTVTNFTNLPPYLFKKETIAVNYSKSIFIIISLLTLIIVVFVVSLIKKNNTQPKEASNIIVPTNKPRQDPNLIPTKIVEPTVVEPTVVEPTVVEPTVVEPTAITPTIIEPTEIVIARGPSLTPETNPTEVVDKPQVLPETGSWEKGLVIVGIAILTVFFSFWF